MKTNTPVKLANAMMAAALISSLYSIQPASAQTSYMMTCKPGGNMYNYTRSDTIGRVATTVYFEPGSQGASVQAPRPGQCTWIDRGLRAGEPHKLLIAAEPGVIKASCNTRGCNTKTNAPISSKLLEAITKNRTFQVHVYNDQNGFMKITKFGP